MGMFQEISNMSQRKFWIHGYLKFGNSLRVPYFINSSPTWKGLWRGSNYLFSIKSSKIDKRKSVSHIELFLFVLLLNFPIHMNSRLKKQ